MTVIINVLLSYNWGASYAKTSAFFPSTEFLTRSNVGVIHFHEFNYIVVIY